MFCFCKLKALLCLKKTSAKSHCLLIVENNLFPLLFEISYSMDLGFCKCYRKGMKSDFKIQGRKYWQLSLWEKIKHEHIANWAFGKVLLHSSAPILICTVNHYIKRYHRQRSKVYLNRSSSWIQISNILWANSVDDHFLLKCFRWVLLCLIFDGDSFLSCPVYLLI